MKPAAVGRGVPTAGAFVGAGGATVGSGLALGSGLAVGGGASLGAADGPAGGADGDGDGDGDEMAAPTLHAATTSAISAIARGKVNRVI